MAERVDDQPLPPRARPPTTGYALLGDGHSALLVDNEGAIDLWAPERFDAPTVFLRLLDDDAGTFETGVRLAHRAEADYLPRSNVHRARLVTRDGTLVVTTFMPHAEAGHTRSDARRVMRLVECEDGPVDLTVNFAPRFAYGARDATVRAAPGGIVASDARGGEEAAPPLALASTLPLDARERDAGGTFRLQPGERHAFVIEHDARADRDPGDVLAGVADALERENAFWSGWLSKCTYEGPYEDAVYRSLLALKLLQYVPEGSFVAAPGFSLPQLPGADRNWDYRYTWLRDGAFIVMAFESTGFKEEALAFRRWLARVVKRDAPDALEAIYHVDGARVNDMTELDHLAGYRDSRPVRVGNKAVHQKQLDRYGNVMICFHRAPELWKEEGDELWHALAALTDHALEHWEEEDNSIWEVATRRQYTYSKGMVWLALDHALTLAEKNGFHAPRDRWTSGKARIREWLDAHGTDEDGVFVQAPENAIPDASMLLFPLFGITRPEDPGIPPLIARIERDLVGHDLAHRHLAQMDAGAEGAFLAVNYWLAHDIAHLGRVRDARRYFDASTRVAGAPGLLPEQADPATRNGRGNYPLGLSHYSLVLAAYAIREAERAREERARDSPRSA